MAVGVGTSCDRDSQTAQSPTEPLNPDPSASPAPPAPPPPPEGAFLAQLSPQQVSQLNSLGIDVVVPGVVPSSFTVAEMRIDQGETGPGYLIVYRDAAAQCFAVEFAAEGIGDPSATQNRLPVQPPLFGGQSYHLNYGEFTEPTMQAQFPGSNLYTDWLRGPSGAYRLIGAAYIKELFPTLASCTDIPPEMAVSLVESFTVLTSEPMGDGENFGLP
ncbi:MAG: hypothetical protein HC929_05505 [Leptolyngbyaceae cyanobacterium SM2_5_2]|nr:hypothetical protein [Leptolyngbyaceae cyanobacterium SM2_5_2]